MFSDVRQLGSTLRRADVYPNSPMLNPKDTPIPDIERASGPPDDKAPNAMPAAVWIAIVVILVVLRVIWERSS